MTIILQFYSLRDDVQSFVLIRDHDAFTGTVILYCQGQFLQMILRKTFEKNYVHSYCVTNYTN